MGAEEIDGYLAGVPQPARDTLAALRRSLHFVPDRPLPDDLVRLLVEATRVRGAATPEPGPRRT